MFESGSRAALDRLGEILRRCDSGRIEIGGYTDSRGREELNQRLSQARAEAVLDALIARGVTLDRLSARGYGEERPAATNDNEAGRALNRRIEFTALVQGR
jgi:OOP family OmpA-OmpF porin